MNKIPVNLNIRYVKTRFIGWNATKPHMWPYSTTKPLKPKHDTASQVKVNISFTFAVYNLRMVQVNRKISFQLQTRCIAIALDQENLSKLNIFQKLSYPRNNQQPKQMCFSRFLKTPKQPNKIFSSCRNCDGSFRVQIHVQPSENNIGTVVRMIISKTSVEAKKQAISKLKRNNRKQSKLVNPLEHEEECYDDNYSCADNLQNAQQ